jgi:protein-tyrosine phosphatase
MSRLPAPRDPAGPYRVALVCLGNICRSPMADVVLSDRVTAAGLDVEVVSAGTGNWHVGGSMDARAAATLTGSGYDASRHEAQQVHRSWFEDCDLVLAMDTQNLADLAELRDGPGSGDDAAAWDGRPGDVRLRLFRDFDPLADESDRSVPDPYYGGDDGFETVLAMVERTVEVLVGELERLRAGG